MLDIVPNRKWLKRNTYHFVFIISLFMLSTLVSWWAVFIYRSVNETYQFRLQGMMQSAQLHAFTLGHSRHIRPVAGGFGHDRRLEIVKASEAMKDDGDLCSYNLGPYWPAFSIQPSAGYLAKIVKEHRSRRVMIIGESSLLVLLILVSGFMIYRMYWLERRTTSELHEFWSRVSHEIKTPITGLKAFLETLRDQELDREELNPLIDLSLKQVERQQMLAENMLVGQKLRKRGMDILLVPVDLVEYAHNYLENHSLKIVGNHVDLKVPEGETIIANGDREALRIIFDNITDNALKYTGVDLQLSIIIQKSDSRYTVSFIDNGPGFDPGIKDNIFGAYKRLKGELPGGPHGTGMGLYISRKLARKMGGDLTASSEGKGKGAQFTLYLDKAGS